MSVDATSDAQSFYEFLGAQIPVVGASQSPEQILQSWRDRQEYESTVASVRESVADMDAGRMTPVRELLKEGRGPR